MKCPTVASRHPPNIADIHTTTRRISCDCLYSIETERNLMLFHPSPEHHGRSRREVSCLAAPATQSAWVHQRLTSGICGLLTYRTIPNAHTSDAFVWVGVSDPDISESVSSQAIQRSDPSYDGSGVSPSLDTKRDIPKLASMGRPSSLMRILSY